jgi:hypothetical protein
MDEDATSDDTLIKFGIRLSWGLAGPLTLFFLGAYIQRDARPPLSFASLLYFGVLLLILVLRLFDIEFLSGTTLRGRPASFKDWRSYATTVALIATLGWGGVQYVIWKNAASEPAKVRLDPAW